MLHKNLLIGNCHNCTQYSNNLISELTINRRLKNKVSRGVELVTDLGKSQGWKL